MKWKPKSKVLIQGITEPLASYYALQMKTYGTHIVAGVAVGQGGESLGDIPIFDLVEEAVSQAGEIETTLIFVPPYEVLDASLEAIAAGIKQLILISSGVPPLDMIRLLRKAQTNQTFVLGSGSQGMIVPGKLLLGICEAQFYTPGKIGLISRSDRLTDEVASVLTQASLGQSLAVSLGIDGITGSSFEQWLQILEEDEGTDAIVLVGQLGSSAEIAAAEYIANAIEKPVVAYIAGLYSPLERNFGDADTIIATQLSYSIAANNQEQYLLRTLKEANVRVAQRLWDLPNLVQEALTAEFRSSVET